MAGLVVDISPALKATMSYDATVRQPAEQHLTQFREANFPSYLASLIAELSNDTRDADVRQAAGLLLKNAVDAKDEARRQELNQKWTAVDPAIKQNIRDVLLQCVHSPVADVRKTTAMVVAKIGGIDVRNKEWPTLVQTLLNNMGAQPPVPGTRQATLMTLGFLCEEVGDDTLTSSEVNLVLTAIVAGMGPSEADEPRLAAIQALTNAIRFAHQNFSIENERNYLMQVVCQGTQAANQEIRLASFMCLHEISENYYDKLVPYMTELYNLTVKAMKEDQEGVATQAVEFWSTVADFELDLLDDGEEAACHNFIRQASTYLVPVLLELLTKQDEEQQEDDGTWNRSMAAGACLDLVAKIIRDSIVPLVLPFVTGNISKNEKPEDWHFREAATYAFGAIMDGPSPGSLDGIVRQGLPFLLNAVKDPHSYVRETTAWTLKQIFQFVHGQEPSGTPPLVSPDMLRSLVTVLLEALKDEAHVAKRVCEAFAFLAQGFDCSEAETSPLSPYFRDVVQALFECAERHHAHDHASVHVAAYESVNDLVSCSARDTLQMVAVLVGVVLDQIEKTLTVPAASAEAQEKLTTLQGLFCGMLSTSIEKLARKEDSKTALVPLADRIFEVLLKVFNNGRGQNVHEGAMLAMGVFVQATGEHFLKYMAAFYPYLRLGLQNHQEWQVCLSTVGVLGDLCRALGPAIAPSCDDIITIMLSNLGSAAVHRTIKPELLVTFGDIALAVEAGFFKYLDPVRTMLNQAMIMSIQMAQTSMTTQDLDTYDYNTQLRRGIIGAYSGILQGLGDELKDNKLGHAAALKEVFNQEVPRLMEFVASIGADKTVDEYDDGVARAAVSLLGDLTFVLPESKALLAGATRTEWHELVKFVKEMGDGDSGSVMWAVDALQAATGRLF